MITQMVWDDQLFTVFYHPSDFFLKVSSGASFSPGYYWVPGDEIDADDAIGPFTTLSAACRDIRNTLGDEDTSIHQSARRYGGRDARLSRPSDTRIFVAALGIIGIILAASAAIVRCSGGPSPGASPVAPAAVGAAYGAQRIPGG